MNPNSPRVTKAQLTKMYASKKQSCKARKISFKLSKEEYKELMLSPVCAYTGIELTINNTGTNARKATDVTLERVNCEQGYTVDNTIAVCHAANSAKAVFDGMLRDDGLALLKKMAEAVARIESKSVVEKVQSKEYSLTQRFVLWLNKVVGISN